MCGLHRCWRTSPGVHLGLIVGQKQMFLSACVFVCMCTWLLHHLKMCVCTAVYLTQMYLLLLKCLFVSVSVSDPLVSVYVYLHVPLRVYICASLYLFLCYIWTLLGVLLTDVYLILFIPQCVEMACAYLWFLCKQITLAFISLKKESVHVL